VEFHGLGINGKISELQAAMGLSVFPYLSEILDERRKTVEYYNSELNLENLSRPHLLQDTEWNHSYYPILFESEKTLLAALKACNEAEIFPRRYFYPALHTLPYIEQQGKFPIAIRKSVTILCLPLYVGLKEIDLLKIISIVKEKCNSR
jgi:dTDP-4-amino-4,6-dideoxygalactose transaminase